MPGGSHPIDMLFSVDFADILQAAWLWLYELIAGLMQFFCRRRNSTRIFYRVRRISFLEFTAEYYFHICLMNFQSHLIYSI